MTPKQFFDWQTNGGTNDVMLLIECLEKADISWCVIGGLAVNHYAVEPMVTQDVDLVVTSNNIEKTIEVLQAAGFKMEKFPWSINFYGRSKISIQISLEEFYLSYPLRAVPADIHGILMRVACIEDTLKGKICAYRDPTRRTSKKYKDLGDIARLVESYPKLWVNLDSDIKEKIPNPDEKQS